ncbi:MAG: NADH-ubiquinone oxidoreductase-F iron-sulfur binding region domain-containing protein [Acidimicrobiales bacterium]
MTATLPRVLTGSSGRPLTIREHELTFGASKVSPSLLNELDASGLMGRGGAAFTTSTKVELLRTQRAHHKVLVVNAMEGEPVGHKDRTLLTSNPHLVLDGAQCLATLIGARSVAVCVSRKDSTIVHHVQRALHERELRGAGPEFVLHTPPWRYVAGEESALVHWLNDNETMPQYRPTRPSILHVGRAPALVVNAETCAHVALINRFGATWFRELGTHASPGSTLVSVTGAVQRPTVLEVALGTPLRSILQAAGADPNPLALLSGGYGGTWIDAQHLDAAYCNEALRPIGGFVGAGILVVLPQQSCGLVETYRIAKWMANESSRQCGPCAFGLPAIAEDLRILLAGSREPHAVVVRLKERCTVVEGRGACRHPDGVVRLVESMLQVFARHVEDHANGLSCEAAKSTRRWVAVPALEHESELVWE